MASYKKGNLQVDDVLPTVEKRVTQEQIGKYAEAAGDFNPVHVDHEYAATTQFGGTIAHGMLIAALISEMMTGAFQERWLGNGRLKIRFKAPVLPGDEITAFGKVKSIKERDGGSRVTCSVGVRKQNGEMAISGDATVDI